MTIVRRAPIVGSGEIAIRHASARAVEDADGAWVAET
jgi:hypothetical protein